MSKKKRKATETAKTDAEKRAAAKVAKSSASSTPSSNLKKPVLLRILSDFIAGIFKPFDPNSAGSRGMCSWHEIYVTGSPELATIFSELYRYIKSDVLRKVVRTSVIEIKIKHLVSLAKTALQNNSMPTTRAQRTRSNVRDNVLIGIVFAPCCKPTVFPQLAGLNYFAENVQKVIEQMYRVFVKQNISIDTFCNALINANKACLKHCKERGPPRKRDKKVVVISSSDKCSSTSSTSSSALTAVSSSSSTSSTSSSSSSSSSASTSTSSSTPQPINAQPLSPPTDDRPSLSAAEQSKHKTNVTLVTLSITQRELRNSASAMLSVARNILQDADQLKIFQTCVNQIIFELMPQCIDDDNESEQRGRIANIKLLELMLNRKQMNTLRPGFQTQLEFLKREQLVYAPAAPAVTTPTSSTASTSSTSSTSSTATVQSPSTGTGENHYSNSVLHYNQPIDLNGAALQDARSFVNQRTQSHYVGPTAGYAQHVRLSRVKEVLNGNDTSDRGALVRLNQNIQQSNFSSPVKLKILAATQQSP